MSTMLIAVWEKQRWPGLALVSPDVFPPQSSHQMQGSIWLLRISDPGHGLSELHPGLLQGRTRALILLDSRSSTMSLSSGPGLSSSPKLQAGSLADRSQVCPHGPVEGRWDFSSFLLAWQHQWAGKRFVFPRCDHVPRVSLHRSALQTCGPGDKEHTSPACESHHRA